MTPGGWFVMTVSVLFVTIFFAFSMKIALTSKPVEEDEDV